MSLAMHHLLAGLFCIIDSPVLALRCQLVGVQAAQSHSDTQVMPVVRELGRFAGEEDVDCIGQLLQRWQMLLQYDLQQVKVGPSLYHAQARAFQRHLAI